MMKEDMSYEENKKHYIISCS